MKAAPMKDQGLVMMLRGDKHDCMSMPSCHDRRENMVFHPPHAVVEGSLVQEIISLNFIKATQCAAFIMRA
jgi:hypothetical protein